MCSFEVLCVTMRQNDFSKIKEMNIHSNVVFANQCDHTEYKVMEFEGHTAKMISTETRGVGINRNMALVYASAEICLLADDDVIYCDDMEKKVVQEFKEHPDADLIIFHLATDDPVRVQVSYSQTKKWPKWKGLPWGGVRIAFRLEALRKANVWFTTLFGGGALFPSGEDSMFLMDLRKAGFTFYVSKETIGKVYFDNSSWFTGHDEKYFWARGAFYGATKEKLAYIWMLYYAFRIKDSAFSLKDRLNYMKEGYNAYKKMMPYDIWKKII